MVGAGIMNYGSKKVASCAVKMALTESREEENRLKKQYQEMLKNYIDQK